MKNISYKEFCKWLKEEKLDLDTMYNNINNMLVTNLGLRDLEEIKANILQAIENNETNIEYPISKIERVAISWENGNLKIENISDYDKSTVRKIYAITEYTNKGLYEITNARGGQYEGQTYIDRFAFYEDMTKEEIIQEIFDNVVEADFDEDTRDELMEEIEKDFSKKIFKTSYGYIEMLP